MRRRNSCLLTNVYCSLMLLLQGFTVSRRLNIYFLQTNSSAKKSCTLLRAVRSITNYSLQEIFQSHSCFFWRLKLNFIRETHTSQLCLSADTQYAHVVHISQATSYTGTLVLHLSQSILFLLCPQQINNSFPQSQWLPFTCHYTVSI
jgi:hypothetical protein